MKKKVLVLIAVVFTTGLVVGQEFKFKGEVEINPRELVFSKLSKGFNSDASIRVYVPKKHFTVDINTGLGYNSIDYGGLGTGFLENQSILFYNIGLGLSYFRNIEKKGLFVGAGLNFRGVSGFDGLDSDGSFIPYLNVGYRANITDKFFLSGGVESQFNSIQNWSTGGGIITQAKVGFGMRF